MAQKKTVAEEAFFDAQLKLQEKDKRIAELEAQVFNMNQHIEMLLNQ